MRRWLSVVVFFCLLVIPAATQVKKEFVRLGPDVKAPFISALKARGFIYISGAIATDKSGQFAGGDIKAQTRGVLDRLTAVLEAAGSGIDRVVSVNVYLRNTSDFPAMNEVYHTYWPKDPPARTTVAADLVIPASLVEMSMIAVPNGAPRQVVHPADWIKSPNPYSYGILSGDTMYLAGLLARNGKDNVFVKGDIKIQTQTVMNNAAEILKAGGMTFADVVATRVYITDTGFFQDMNATYRTYYPQNPPARATVKSALMSPDAVVEISYIAVKGGDKEAINPPNPDGSPAQPNPNLSSAIRVGNRLFLSGMLGNDATNKGDAAAQTRATLERIGRTLKAAGFGWQDVVDSLVYVTDPKNMDAMNSGFREAFKTGYPARVAVQAGLVSPDGLVEIMCTAIK